MAGVCCRSPPPPLLLMLLLAASAAVTIPGQYHRTFRSSETQLTVIDGRSSPRGSITSEGFTDPPWARRDWAYSATWLLEAPPNHTVFVYMTQYHLADGDLRVSSFHICYSLGRGVLQCSWDRPAQHLRSLSVEAAKNTNIKRIRSTTEYAAPMPGDPWLVLELDLPAGGGGGPADACLHSTESRGFNVTYEFVKMMTPSGSNVKALARRDRCTLQLCNFNGDCLASADFGRYGCRCRPGFYGDWCEHGSLCDPKNEVNPCQNDGKCRQRRDVVECKCEPPYDGTRCETRVEGLQEPNYCLQLHDPHTLSCEVGCLPHGSTFRCGCHPGHQLLANGSCSAPPDLRRYIIEVTVTDTDIQLDQSNIESRLNFNHSNYSLAEPLQLIAVDNSVGGGPRRLVLLLRALRSDELAVYRWFAAGVTRGQLGVAGVRPLTFSFHSEPELAITSLTLNDDDGPRKVGSQAHLTCTVRGTDSTEVVWYKDGARINITRASLLRGHNMSVGRFHRGGEQYNHYLSLDHLVPEDEGRFQCRPQEALGGRSRNRSSPVAPRAVRLTLPSLQLALRVTPPLVSVRPGRNVTLTCTLLSSKSNRNNSVLVWSRAVGRADFRPVTSQDHEQVVSFCQGRSVLIIREPETARYECAVHLGSLSNRLTAEVLVLTPGHLTCPRVTEGEVTWQETAVGRQDKQPCPGGDDDIVLPGRLLKLPVRYARRSCEHASRTRARWSEPDFSECVDRELFVLCKQVDQLLAGYDVTSLESVLSELHQLVSRRLEAARERRPPRLLDAEVETFRHLLVNLASYMMTVATDEQLSDVEEDFMQTVVSVLGDEGATRLGDQHKAELLSATMDYLLRRVFHPRPIKSRPPDLFVTTRRLRYDGSGVHGLLMPFHTRSRPRWLGMVAEITLSADQPWRSHALPSSELGLVVAVIRDDTRALYPGSYTPEYSRDDPGRSSDLFTLNSRLVSIGLSKQPRLLESPFPPSVEVTLTLEPIWRHWNVSNQHHSCAQLSAEGRWVLDACDITPGNHSVNCSCDRLGTFALALVTRQQSPLSSVLRSLHVPVVVGCVLSLLVLLYCSAVLLLYCWRQPSALAGLQLQGALVLTAAVTVFMVSARDTRQSGQWMAATAASLQCLVLSAMSTQMAIKMHVFGEQFRLKRLRGEPNYFKYIIFFISTGVPLLITAATVTVQVTHGWHQVRSWWIVLESSVFYGLVVPAAILLVTDTYLLLYVRATLVIGVMMLTREKRAWIQYRVSLMMRSQVLEGMLVVLIICSALYVNFPGTACQLVFALSCVITSVTLLVCYVIRGDPGVRTRPCVKKPPEDKRKDGESPEPPATLPSRAALGSSDPSQKPLLGRVCGCRPSPVPAQGDTADSGGSGVCSSTLDTSAASSSSSGGSQRRSPAGGESQLQEAAARAEPLQDDSHRRSPADRQAGPAGTATRAAPLQVEADVIAVDSDAFDPPAKPGRGAAAGLQPESRPARPGSSSVNGTRGPGSKGVNGTRGPEQAIEMARRDRYRAGLQGRAT